MKASELLRAAIAPEHGVQSVAVPWAREGSGFTLLFEALVVRIVLVGLNPGDIPNFRFADHSLRTPHDVCASS